MQDGVARLQLREGNPKGPPLVFACKTWQSSEGGSDGHTTRGSGWVCTLAWRPMFKLDNDLAGLDGALNDEPGR